jgi:hypothetical protein
VATDENYVVDSFKDMISRHISSYKTDKRVQVSKFGGDYGWAKKFHEALDGYRFDVRKTNSLVTPYIGELLFDIKRGKTAFHNTREKAENDDTPISQSIIKHKHTYAFQNGKWIVKSRRHYSEFLNKWVDCNQIITQGENKGQTNLYGCWEE